MLLLSSTALQTSAQAKEAHANAGQRKQSRMAARANRRQAMGNRLNSKNRSFSQSNTVRARQNQNVKVENDETHWVGHDRTKNVPRQINQNQGTAVENDETHTVGHDRNSNRRRRKRDRTESVSNNETITVNASKAGGQNSLMEEEGIYYFRKKGQRRFRNANIQQ